MPDRQEPEGRRIPRARAGLGQVVALTVALGAFNLLVGLLPVIPLGWATFPVHETPFAREAITLSGLFVLTLVPVLRSRGFWAWVILVSTLLWSVLGFLVVSWPGLPRPGIVPALVALGILLARRRSATARGSWSRLPRQAGTVYLVLGALIASTVGVRALGEHFNPPIRTWVGALYFVVITFSTVGYGDVVPITPVGRVTAIVVVVFAFISFALAASVVIPALVRTKFKEVFRTMDRIAQRALNEHVIVAGESAETVVLVQELRAQDAKFVLIHENQHFLDAFEEVDFRTIVGDPSQSRILDRANVAKARVLVACGRNDAENAFIVLSARDKNKDLRIVGMANTHENLDKLRIAGADTVVSPPIVGGSLLARAALGESDTLEDLMQAESRAPDHLRGPGGERIDPGDGVQSGEHP